MTLSSHLPFVACTGSVPGTAHTRLHRNNQDAAALSVTSERIVAVVADGCSAGASSEVGARFAAAWLACWLPRFVRSDQPPRVWIDEATAALIAALESLARALSPDDEHMPWVVHDFLLFTFLALVIDAERAVVFGAGDGLFAIDGSVTVLDPGPENAPAYLAYALLPASATNAPPRAPLVAVHCDVATSTLRSVLLATDGANDIANLDELAHPSHARNPSLLQKRLAARAALHPRLADDTTIALVRRKEIA